MEILATDTVYEMARKIFTKFTIGQSCAVDGYVELPDESIEHKGKCVLAEISKMDIAENFGNQAGEHLRYKNGVRRRRVKLPNVVGDSVAHKSFKWEMRLLDNSKPRYTIWRIQ